MVTFRNREIGHVEQPMDHAREQSKSGQPVVMQKRADEAPSGEGPTAKADNAQRFESNVVLPSDLNPKTVASNSISQR